MKRIKKKGERERDRERERQRERQRRRESEGVREREGITNTLNQTAISSVDEHLVMLL